MIPTFDIDVCSEIPADAVFWQPTPSEVSDDGFGFFHDVWPIIAPTCADTRAVLKSEDVGLRYLQGACQDAIEFEDACDVLEGFNADDPLCDPLPDAVASTWTGLNGLEIGVAGLVYSLANAGFYPAASCRAHRANSWAPCPTVIFAAGETRLRRLLPIVAETGCGLSYTDSRGPFFDIYAPSVLHLSRLAHAVFDAHAGFRAISKTNRRRSPGTQAEQLEIQYRES